jgi:hypothetical protein
MSWDNLVVIVTGYGLDGQGSNSDRDKIFLYSIASRLAWHPPGLLSSQYQGLFHWGKSAGHETDRSPPSSAEVKNDGAIPPLPDMSSWHNA